MRKRPERRARFDLVGVASCEISPIAHLLRGRLEAEGIVAFVADETIADWYWPYSRAAGGVSVLVPADVVPRALEILESPPEVVQSEDASLAGCPVCGSIELERDYPLRRIILILFTLGFIVSYGLMLPAGVLCAWRWWHCRTCDEWSRRLRD
jgi:hypothetical protein